MAKKVPKNLPQEKMASPQKLRPLNPLPNPPHQPRNQHQRQLTKIKTAMVARPIAMGLLARVSND
jgi:hypothetical protein